MRFTCRMTNFKVAGGNVVHIKKEIVSSLILAFLGLGLIVGGTNAYFSDTKETANTFELGLMNLGINKESIIQLDDFIPGDTVQGDFELTNDGSVDMQEVVLHSSYELIDKGQNNNGDDLGNHINVEFLHHESVLFEKLLSELNGNPIKILNEFTAGSKAEKFIVRFHFIDNGENQNHFQGDILNLKWGFEAAQRDGKSSNQ